MTKKISSVKTNNLPTHSHQMPKNTVDELKKENLQLRAEIELLKSENTSLRHNQERLNGYQALIETADGFAWETDACLKYTYCSLQAEKLWGLRPEDLLGKTPLDVMTPGSAATSAEFFSQIVSDPKPFSGVRATASVNGHLVHVETNGVPFFDEDNRLLGFRGITRDISNPKQLEDDLRRVAAEYKRNEEKSNLTVQRLQSHIDNSPLAVIEFDTEYRITYWSNKAESLFGWSAGEVIGKSIPDIRWVHEDDAARVAVLSAEMTAGVKTSNIHTNKSYRKDGSVVVCMWYNSALRDTKGKLVSVHSNVLDITDQYWNDRALKESEERFRVLIEASPAGIIMWENNRILYANEAAVLISGYSKEELMNTDHLDLIHPDFREAMQQAMRKRMAGSNTTDHYLIKAMKKSGDEGWFDISAGLINRGGSPAGIVSFVDVTGKRKILEELKNSKRRLEFVLSHSLDAAYQRNLKVGKYDYISPAIERVLGFSAADMMNSDHILLESAHPDFRPVIESEIKSWEEIDKNVGDLEYRLRTKSGDYRWISDHFNIVRDSDGKPLYRIGMLRDITQRKNYEETLDHYRNELETRVQERTEELRAAYEALRNEITEKGEIEERLRQSQKMEAIGTLAGGIAHDFNNMLAIIIGNAELAIDDTEKQSVRKNLDRILTASKRSRKLVKQILTFSRKDTGERKPIRVLSIVQETYAMLRSSVPSIVDMHLNTSVSEDMMITADASQLQQIVMNLVNNAVYAMGVDGGDLTIDLSTLTEQDSAVYNDIKRGDYIKLMVKDTGTGISAEVQQRMFDPFFTTKEAPYGTGMGLSVVYGIVNSYDGVIKVNSQVGKGSEFLILIPYKREIVETSDENSDIGSTRGNGHILLIDDEPDVLDMMQNMLTRLGYDVTAKTDASEALEEFKKSPHAFDVIITDQTMPGITGVALARKFLSIRKDQPIILSTGYSETVTPEIAKDAGIKSFIMKPAARNEIAKIVRSLIDRLTR